VNLPNAMTFGRIAATPLIAGLVVSAGWQPRLSAWVLYVAAAVTDYFDGKMARERNLVTDTGKLLDPLADKLLLLATLVPMYWLMRDVSLLGDLPNQGAWAAGTVGPVLANGTGSRWVYPFVTPVGLVGLPLWIVLVVLGRELFMIVFRSYAARRGVIISAIGPAKWKMTLQSIWVGAAFFWFFSSAVAAEHQWTSGAWNAFAMVNGVIGVVSMVGAVALTIYSLWLYLRRYGALLVGNRDSGVGTRESRVRGPE
jgi:phosphatidylglycerophosphate synthase